MNVKYSNHDRYLDDETGVLKNIRNISDAALLEEYESEYAALRAFELSQKPIPGHFDLDHLRAIHCHLFKDVYAWAGEIRDVDIAKEQSLFAHHTYIESAAKTVFEHLAAENYLSGLDAEAFSERAAYYLGELNALHAFREGNGRTQREFINHLAYKNGYAIAWAGIDRERMLEASIESFQTGDSSKLKALIAANIQPLDAARKQDGSARAAPERQEADPGQKRREMIERCRAEARERLNERSPEEQSHDRARERKI